MIRKNKALFDTYQSKDISFIFATKNRANELQKSLENLKKIKSKRDELLVIDGQSNDHTYSVLKKYSSIIDIFISEPDDSPAHAVNKGILLSSGRYIMQVADEDSYNKKSIKQLVKIMDNNPQIDLLVCGGTKQFKDKFKVVWLPKGTNYGKNTEDVFRYGAAGVGFFFRKSLIAKVGFYPNRLASDLAFVIECIQKGVDVKFCRINLYNHPINLNSMTVRKKSDYMKDFYCLLKENTSLFFYLRYRAEIFLKKHLLFLQIANRIFNYQKFSIRKSISTTKINWDSEFS